ncbi:MAG TPA: endonuclease/exonuclease/phosphatase family protein [Streptosporangiaceae bacterium]|nr:endonuclease/exonuclease/phosphatase family protein [Streptosporangiaceae bacterium]
MRKWDVPARRLEWAVASGIAGWALARVAAADRLAPTSSQAVAMLSFTPQAAAVAWAGALLLRDERAATAAAVAAGAMTAAIAPRAVVRRQPAAAGPVLRVLTANLFVGRAEPEPVVDLVREAEVDVLFAQELTADKARSLALAGLGDLLPHSVNDVGMPGSRRNAIYARLPLAPCPAIPATPWAQPTATLSLPGGVVRLVCVHLHTPKPVWSGEGVAAWRSELRALQAMPTPGGPPVIMAGDFNSTLDHAEFRRLLRRGFVDAASQTGYGLVPTWGRKADRRLGLLTLDHVLADPRCALLGTSVHRLPGSDHRAVLATIQLP